LLVLGDARAKTLSVGLQFFAANQDAGDQLWGALMAVAGLAILPPLLLYVVAQRRVLGAFVETAIK